MKLIQIGFGNFVSDERIVAVVSPDSAPRDNTSLVDATYGRKTQTVIVMDSGHVVLSALTPEVVEARVVEKENEND